MKRAVTFAPRRVLIVEQLTVDNPVASENNENRFGGPT
jgi:hypothetical protein